MNRKYHKRTKDAKKRQTNARRQNARALLAFEMARARFWPVRMRVHFIQEIRVGWMENVEEDDIFYEVARINKRDEDETMLMGVGVQYARGLRGTVVSREEKGRNFVTRSETSTQKRKKLAKSWFGREDTLSAAFYPRSNFTCGKSWNLHLHFVRVTTCAFLFCVCDWNSTSAGFLKPTALCFDFKKVKVEYNFCTLYVSI